MRNQGFSPTQKQLVGDVSGNEIGLVNKAVNTLSSPERAGNLKSVSYFNIMVTKLREAGLLNRSGKYILTKAGEEFILSLPEDLYQWPAIVPYENGKLDLHNATYYPE